MTQPIRQSSTEKSLGEQSYEQFADRYAAVVETKPHNAYLVRPAVLPMVPDVSGLRVLDAGCGSGWYSQQFLDRGARIVAFDVTPAFVEIARQKVGDRATVLRHDLTQPLDFAADAGFDLVFSNLVLDYIEDWGAVFKEWHRVLVPGGVLVFSSGHPAGDWQYMKQMALPVEGGPHYFSTQRFDAYWSGFGEPKPLVKGYRRPLAAMLNPLIEAGFALDRIAEAQPTEQFRQADPAGYERIVHEPTFLCVRAVKPPSCS